ncbi:hypothetical protein LOD99_15696 [Oopsacas minuta]|uniref:Uncharacterized protein n=1 Tax=Oopsacas minuta TaxID=111878 RepID=A0AAV7KD34_9METZ|nr:hypothetical protein LOD99_15696 [Oopsacas minuta]
MMASRERKQSNRLSLSLSLLSPKKKSTTHKKSLYISKPLNSFGPSGESLGIHSDDVILPLRVYCEIFGPSVHYKSVGVSHSTTALFVIQNLIDKMNRVDSREERDCSYTEFCLVETSVLPEYSYFRLLDDATTPLHLYQQHSKRYGNSDTWRLKLIFKSQLKSTANLMLHINRNLSMIGVAVDCNCLEDTFLSVCFHYPATTTCDKIINKIITEFAYDRQPGDFCLYSPDISSTTSDPLDNDISLEVIQKQSRAEVIELSLRNRYDDIVGENDLNTEGAVYTSESYNNQPEPQYSEQSDETADPWIEHYDSVKGKIYYLNSKSEEIIWVHPTTQQEMYLDSDMPPGWVRGVQTDTGRIYYKNTFDKKIEWSHPLRHLQRIYKHSLQPIGTSLPRPTAPPLLHKPPTRCPPPVPNSARPTLALPPLSGLEHLIREDQTQSLNSSQQNFSDMERASSDALLTEFLAVPSKHKNHTKKNKRLNNLRKLLVNEKYSDDSDNISLGSGHKIKSFFTTNNSRKKNTGSTPPPDVVVKVTPNPSPAGRKKSIVSATGSEKSFLLNELSSLPRNFSASKSRQERDQFSSNPENTDTIIATQDNVTEKYFARSISDVDHSQSAGLALDEAFSLLDNDKSIGGYNGRGKVVEEIYENKNALLDQSERDSINDCFEIIDSSFDEGSGQEMNITTQDYNIIVGENQEVFNPVREDDSSLRVSETNVATKVSLFEQKLNGNKLEEMNALVGDNTNLSKRSDTRDRPESICSSSGSCKSEDTEGRNKNALRTRKGRMSRNTSALNHQELEELNKGIEPQKSCLKHSNSQVEDNVTKKGVTFLSSAVQMIEIERRRASESNLVTDLDTQTIIHKRSVGDWRNMLKTFYDEVDKQGEKGDSSSLVWSPDEGIGLVEEERFINEANKLTVDEQELFNIESDKTEEEVINSLKESLIPTTQYSSSPQRFIDSVSHAPVLPPRPTPDDLATFVTSSPSIPDSTSDNSLPVTPKQTQSDVTLNTSPVLDDDKVDLFSFSKETATTGDNSRVTDSGMFSLEVSTNIEDLSPRQQDNSQSLTQLVFDTLSSTLADTAVQREPFTDIKTQQDLPIINAGDEPVIVSSLVEPITPNAMIPMDVFMPKERPSLQREQLIPRPLLQQQYNIDTSLQDDVTSPIEHPPSPVSTSPIGPSRQLQALPNIRSISPVLVDQLNKPLSGTPFIHGYQYQRKPADKTATLHSGYLALVNQQGEQESKLKMKLIN